MKALFIAPIIVPHINLETYFFNALKQKNITFARYGYNEMKIDTAAARVAPATKQKRLLVRLAKKILPASVFSRRAGRRAQMLFETIEKTVPDFLLAFSKGIPPQVVNQIKAKYPSLPLIGLAVDDPQDFERSKTHSPHYHLFFSTPPHCWHSNLLDPKKV